MPTRDVTQRISDDILQHQLQLAKNATPGEWYDAGNGIIAAKRGARTPSPVAQVDNEKDAAHIAANSPDVVTANIDEILRLRAEVQRLEKEADWLATHFANALIDPCRVIQLQDLFKPLYLPTREMLRDVARRAVAKETP